MPVWGLAEESYPLFEQTAFTILFSLRGLADTKSGASAGLVGGSLLGALPRGAIFLNGGRGSTVDTGAVVAALGTGQLRAAVLDVFPEEPLADDDPLWTVDNLFITSHTAAPTDPGAIVELFLANLARYRAGDPLADVVDFSRLSWLSHDAMIWAGIMAHDPQPARLLPFLPNP